MFLANFNWRCVSVDRYGWLSQIKTPAFSQTSAASSQHGRERGVNSEVICILYIGALALCIAVSRLIWACANYVDRAKPAKDVNLGLQVPMSHGTLNLGVSGKNGPSNAKDHPPLAKIDGHKH